MFEPGVEVGNESANTIMNYMSTQLPEMLPRYLEAFAGPSTKIYDGPKMGVCSGPGGDKGEHFFTFKKINQ